MIKQWLVIGITSFCSLCVLMDKSKVPQDTKREDFQFYNGYTLSYSLLQKLFISKYLIGGSITAEVVEV
jgi:hypothetical protein